MIDESFLSDELKPIWSHFRKYEYNHLKNIKVQHKGLPYIQREKKKTTCSLNSLQRSDIRNQPNGNDAGRVDLRTHTIRMSDGHAKEQIHTLGCDQ